MTTSTRPAAAPQTTVPGTPDPGRGRPRKGRGSAVPQPCSVSVDGSPAFAERQGARIGYGRVSTTDQDANTQVLRLEAAGCVRTFTETISSRVKDRPQLAACLDYLRPGDALVAVRLDRLARSTRELLELAQGLEQRGIDLVVLDQQIDTRTPAGRLLFTMLAAIGEFERDLIRERTMDGLARARSEGKPGGRRASITGQRAQLVRRLAAEGQSVRAIAAAIEASPSAVHRLLSDRKG
jgi:DNA invertase Pin-like site-specific DNA recombinase